MHHVRDANTERWRVMLSVQLTECISKKREAMQENVIKQNDVLAYLGDNVKKVKHRMRKAKYGCMVID